MISVIIPVYNAEPYLRRCLNSVLASVYPNFELILVNDGSTDGSPGICEEYAARDSRVVLISQENRGVSAARNRALDICRGEWVVFVDADDLISPGFLSLVAQEEYQEQDLLLFNVAECADALSVSAPAPETIWFGPEDMPKLLHSLFLRLRQLAGNGNPSLTSPWAKAFRRELIDRLHLCFDTQLFYGEDQLFNLKYMASTTRYAHIPVPVYYYDIRPGSSSQRFLPGLPEDLLHMLEEFQHILEAENIFALLEKDFYTCAMETLVYSLIWNVFAPENPQTYRERVKACRALRGNPLYRKALECNRTTGHCAQKILILLFRLRLYFAVGMASRLSYYYLLRRQNFR